MAYDEDLAERVQAALGPEKRVTELKMFGGLCFMVGGNMAIGVINDDLMVRLSPDDGKAALAEPHARPMDFTGKPMRGFVYVGPSAKLSDKVLASWVARGVTYAKSLPPKKPRPKKPPRL